MRKISALCIVISAMVILSIPFSSASRVTTAGDWSQIWGPIGTVVGGSEFPDPDRGSTVYATKLPEGDIYEYDRDISYWTWIGGPGKKFVSVGSQLYALSPDGNGVFRYNGTPGQWTQIGGAAGEIYGGPAGLFATNPQSGNILAYNCNCGGVMRPGWTTVGGPGKMFAVGAEALYGLSPDGSGILQFDFAFMHWTRIGGPATAIYAGGDRLFARYPQSGDIYEYMSPTDEWVRIGGPGKAFAADPVTGDLYALNPDASGVNRYTGTPGRWEGIGGAAGSIYPVWPHLYATSPGTANLWQWDNSQAYQQSQTAWTRLPDITSHASPAIAEHSDGKLYAAAVALNGLTAFTSTTSPGAWAQWKIIGPEPSQGPTDTPAFYADPYTSPALIRFGNVLYLFARGNDDNLYLTFKSGTSNWASFASGVTWQSLTTDGRVRGRFSVALTAPGDSGGNFDIHVIYSGQGNTVEYRQFDFTGNPMSSVKTWANAVDGCVGTDGSNQVWMAIRTTQRQLLIENRFRLGPYFMNPPTYGWVYGHGGPVTSRLADGPQGTFYDMSNVVYFGGAYHVVYSMKYLADDVSGSYGHSLVHTRIRPGYPDDGYVRFIMDYSPQGNDQPRSELILYRNKLVVAYTDHRGWIRSARWDNADPSTPWVDMGVVSWGRSSQRPVLGLLNRRPNLSGTAYENPNFGNDLFAVVNDSRNNGLLWVTNLSRGMFYKDINPQLYVYTYNLNAGCPPQSDPTAPVLVPDITQLDWPFLSELGYNFWMLPNWLIGTTGNRVFREGPRQDCLAGRTDGSGRFGFNFPGCDTAKYVVIIKPGGGIYVCSGAWLNRDSDYLRVWEELGHPMTTMFGLKMDAGSPNTPTQEKADLTGIPLSALQQAASIFNQGTNAAQSCQLGTAAGGRCRGFTGIAGNYDAGTEQHSFIYALYYYVSDGDQLRSWIQDDLQNNVSVLQQKYNWIKDHIYRGVEFRSDSDPWVH